MTGPHSQGQTRSDGDRPAAADGTAVLAGRAAPDPWAEGERNERAAGQARSLAPARQVQLGRGTAFEQAQANAQGQARAAHAAVATEQQRAREATEAQPAVAARAAAPAVVVPPRRELRPRPPRKGLTLGSLHIGQVVVWQVALLASVAALGLPVAWTAAIIALSVVAVVLTAVPLRGRWLYQWAGLGMRYAARGKSGTTKQRELDDLAAPVARGASLQTIEIDEQDYGLVSHATGYTAVLEAVKPLSSGQLASTVDLPDLDTLIPAYDPDEPPVSVQVVVSTVPAPGLRGDDAVGLSYRELTEGLVPAQRRTWIAIQALHTPDVHSDSDMRKALINVLRRVERKLEKAGLSVHVLRKTDLHDEFGALVDVMGGPQGDGAKYQERWDHWAVGQALHVTFRILNWPDLSNADGAGLIQSFATVPALSVTVTVAVSRESGRNELEAAVRVVVPDRATLSRAVDQMERIAVASGAELQRMDGEHIFGVGASVPLGGFAS